MNQVEYNIGDIVLVVDQQEGHEFPLGAEVTIMTAKPNRDVYKCSDGVEEWWLNSDEFEKVA